MVGNHVILECGPAWIVLGHMQRGSVAARAGEFVEPGHVLGQVGKGGNTGEPHFRARAATRVGRCALGRRSDADALRWRYLVRNDQAARYLMTGTVPAMVAATNHPTNVTGVLDLWIVVSFGVWEGYGLWRDVRGGV